MRRLWRGGLRVTVALALVAGSAACSSRDDAHRGTLTVLAAASLRAAFADVAAAYEAAHPGERVEVTTGPSTALAAQVAAGAPADVLATASAAAMAPVTQAGLAVASTPFATNRLAVVVPVGSTRVRHPDDLARDGVAVAVCQEQVPCGAGALELFDRLGLDVRPVTQEADVAAVLTKVELGEVDAGVVYATDVVAAGSRVDEVPLPSTAVVTTTSAITALTSASDPTGAAAFVDLVRSPQGQAILARAGFGAP